ncbi:hypothetical protein F2Q69_00008270 [Brassica cretica]|uniref:Uncharacterized protein n=1 Tax=Brassica cretica TaxID=69181 RepID=A0A8S9NTW3_BRACR|nr:hypothetical protein F2Q69_00008270 [Brassica cretica]
MVFSRSFTAKHLHGDSLARAHFSSVSSGILFFKPLRNALNHHINDRLNSSTRFYHYRKFLDSVSSSPSTSVYVPSA